MVGQPALAVMPTAGPVVPVTPALVAMPTVVVVVPVTPGPVELRPLARMLVMRGTLPAVLVLEPPGRAMQRVTLSAGLAVRLPPVPVVLARAVPRRVPRLQVEQDLPPVMRIAVPVAQRLVVTVGPAEWVRVLPAERGRAVLLRAAQVLPAVTARAVPAVPVTPGPVVQRQPVMVVLVVTPLAAIPIPPAVT
jgi:hypothetical protein